MTARVLSVIGGGEHARVVIESARSRSDLWNVDGFVDPDPCLETQRRLGITWLGDDATVLGHGGGRLYVLGVGAVGVDTARRAIVERYVAKGSHFAAVVHGRAWVSPTAVLGEGAVVLAGAVVQSGAHIGAHVVVGSGAIVEHDVTLGDFTQLGPGVVIGGGTSIGENCYLGLGSSVRDHVTVGARAMIAMGAVVVGDVAEGAIMIGVPARARP